jgi:hypothetical protein
LDLAKSEVDSGTKSFQMFNAPVDLKRNINGDKLEPADMMLSGEVVLTKME